MDEKQRILTAAEEKFLCEGSLYKMTMDELATQLRMSKKTIYKHFPSKEILIKEMVENFTERIRNQIEPMLQTEDNAVIKFKNLFTILGSIASRVSDQWLIDLRTYYPNIWNYIDEFRQRMVTKNISEVIEQGKQEGLIADIPSQIIINVFLGAVRTVVAPDFVLNNNFSLHQAMYFTLKIFINGILTEKGRTLYKNSTVENESENIFINI